MKISILVPTYNSGHLIGNALKSALSQSIGDFEILVSDNASGDDTRDVVAAFHDPRILYARHPENIGYTRNVRTLIERARGDFSVVLCADDFWNGDFLGEASKAVASVPNLSLFYSAYERRLTDPAGRVWIQDLRSGRPASCDGRTYVREEFLRPFSILSGCLFRTRCALGSGSFTDPELRFLPDLVHRLKVALQGTVVYHDIPLAVYLEHPASITSSSKAADWAREELKVIRDLLADPFLASAGLRELGVEKRRRYLRASLRRLGELRAAGVRGGDLLRFAAEASREGSLPWRAAARAGAAFLGALPTGAVRKLVRGLDLLRRGPYSPWRQG